MVRCFRVFELRNIEIMDKATTKFVIDYFLNSNKYEFKDFDMNNVIEEIAPLFKSTLENYLYIKKNEVEGKGFIQKSQNPTSEN